MTSQSKNNRLLPLTVIEAAAGGDVEAINAVLKHYAGYIALMSMREIYDEYGNPHLCGAGWKRSSLPSCSHSA